MAPIALHRAKFDLGHGVTVDIEAAIGQGRAVAISWPAGALVGAEEEVEAASVASGGIFPMCWRESGHLFEPFQLREDTDYFVDVTVPVPLAEAAERSKGNPAWPFQPRLANIFKRDPVRRWRENGVAGAKSATVTGQIRLRSHAGVVSFANEFGGSLLAEVACRKLKYFDEFQALLDSLAEKAAELLLSYDSPVSLSFGASEDLATDDSALYFLLRHVMSPSNLPAAIEEIVAMPHVVLVERLLSSPIDEMEEASPDLIVDGLDGAEFAARGPLSRLFRGFTPQFLPQREEFESKDTQENRYAKAFLERCRHIAYRLEMGMAARGRRAAEREAKSWVLLLDEALQHGMWRDIGPLAQIPANSQALLRKRGYKNLFRFDLSLRMSLALAWPQGGEIADGLVGDIRPVSQIYEYWCFFVLREIVKDICREVSGGNFISVSKDGLRIQLTKGRRSECRFEFSAASGEKVLVSLFYNKRFNRSKKPSHDWSGSYTASFDPDFSIVARSTGLGVSSHWLHFDAKYRLERKQAEALFESEEGDEEPTSDSLAYEVEMSRVHKQDDLFKMHTYRDGILSTRGAYVLFPGDGVGGQQAGPSPNIFVRHPSAFGGLSEHQLPSVGAFDLAPGGASAQSAAIRSLLLSAFEIAANGVPYQEEQAFFP